MNLSLKPCTKSDEGFLYELYCNSRAEEMAAWGWGEAQQKAFLQLQFKARQGSYQAQFPDAQDSMVTFDDKAIGRMLVVRNEEEFRLVDIVIHTGYQGKGIGSRLIKDFIDEARQTKKPVRLHVEMLNPAKLLYEKLGFKVIEERGGHYFMEYCD